MQLKRRQALYLLKISQEREALGRKGSGSEGLGPGSPAEHKTIKGQSRQERLASWEATLAEITQKLSGFKD